ncbi:MAG: bifunctional serine/threonine-protein kinase/formylglycine-generating enzyme family protein, partial [Gemmatimonadales bacterium]
MTDLVDQLSTALGDRYQLEPGPDGRPRVLGSGGMAIVYLARDLKHDRPVAVKVLRAELAAALGAERFLREVRIAAHLQHPHILSVLDSGEFSTAAGPPGLFYVMPFVDGESLRDRLARESELPIGEAVRILAEVVDALAFAHAHGIVHRDIKPENVLLSGRHALVADFGVAKAVTAASGASGPTLTTAGIALGTPAYMAPEQATADPHADHRVDLYAVGLLGYEMLTGQLPFRAHTPQALLAAQITATPQPLTELRPATPAGLAAAIMRCLEKHPADRWQTAGELLAALESQITPTGGSPAGGARAIAGAAGTPGRRRRVLIPAVVAGFPLLAALAWWLAGSGHRAEQRWARERAIPEILDLRDRGEIEEAYTAAKKALRLNPGDTALAGVWRRVTVPITIRSDPPGAVVWRRPYAVEESAWDSLGVTPLDSVRLPLGLSRIRLQKDSRSFEGAALTRWVEEMDYTLDGAGGVPQGMSRVAGGEFEINLPGLDHLRPIPLGPYLIARQEVTNREYKRFVDSGGYRRRDLWEHPFDRDGRRLGWAAAMTLFRDRTGRPGPATWEAGGYPGGTADYPVAGISWFEAAAYARFVGRQLPTIYHWNRAAETRASNVIIPASNFAGEGAKAVTGGRGLGPWGTVDMAGNVREWCLNATRDERYILGGGWNDQPYQFH